MNIDSMKVPRVMALTILCILVGAMMPSPLCSEESGIDMTYSISFNELDPYCPDPRWADIELSIENNHEKELYLVFGIMHNPDYCLNNTLEMVETWDSVTDVSAHHEDEGIDIRFSKSAQTLDVLEPLGWTLADGEFDNPGKGAFVVYDAPSELTIEYRVQFQNQRHSMYLFPVNVDISSIRIDFGLPESWIVTPFKREGDHYIVGNYPKPLLETLTSTELKLYPAYFTSKKIGTTDIVLATRRYQDGPLFEANQQRRVEMYSQIFEYFTDVFGRYKYDTFLISDDCSEIGVRDLYSVFSLEAAFSQDPELFNLLTGNGWFRFTYFHEWGHLWNYDLLGPDVIGSWFHDGMGEYFGAVGPRDAFGSDHVFEAYLYFNWEWYRTRWGTYLDMPLAENPCGGSTHPEHWLMYAQGTLFFYMLDEKIKAETDGKKGFYDVLHYMYDNYYNDSITMPMFEESVEHIMGSHIDSFFEDYLYGDTRYPLDHLEEHRDKYYDYMDKNITMFYYDVPILYFIMLELRQKATPQFNVEELFDDPWYGGGRQSFIHFLRDNYDIEQLSESMIIDSLNAYSGGDCSTFFELYSYRDGRLSVDRLKELLLSGKDLRFQANLEPFKATVEISTSPSHCNVFVDDTYRCKTPSGVRLDCGTYDIRVEKNGYESIALTVSVSSNELKTLELELEPLPSTLFIESVQDEVRVSIDGESVGTAPLELAMDPGTYSLVAEKDNHETFIDSIDISPGRDTTVTIDLVEVVSHTTPPPTQPPHSENGDPGGLPPTGLVAIVIVLLIAGALFILKRK